MFLPNQLQSELNLSRRSRGARDGSCSTGRFGASRRRRKRDQVWRVEVCAIEQVKDFSAKLKRKPFVQSCCLEGGEVPGCEPGTGQSVPAQIAIEAAIRWRRDERIRVEPLGRLAKDYRTSEGRIYKWAYRISGVAIVRRVIAELRRKWKPRLHCYDGVHRPPAHERISPPRQAICQRLALTERQVVGSIDDADVPDIVSGGAVVRA